MPSALTYPGVYVEEIPSGVRTIVGVATSITAFVGRTAKGPVNKAVTINSFADFERIFGGLSLESTLSFAVRDFYLNGGSQAVIVRLYHSEFTDTDIASIPTVMAANAAAKSVADAAKSGSDGKDAKAKAKTANDPIQAGAGGAGNEAKAAAKAINDAVQALAEDAKKEVVANAVDNVLKTTLKAVPKTPKVTVKIGGLSLLSAYEGTWGKNLRARIDLDNIDSAKTPDSFNLTVFEATAGGAAERYLNLSKSTSKDFRNVKKVLEAESRLVRWDSGDPDLSALRSAIETLKAAQTANPQIDADIDTALVALWKLTQDSITQAESALGRAKKKLELMPSGSSTTEVDTARHDLEAAVQNLSDSVSDGLPLEPSDFLLGESQKHGMFALEQVDLFNLLCIPPYKADNADADVNLISAAAAYCEKRRAMLLVDSPSSWSDKSKAKEDFTSLEDKIGTRSRNAALYFPRLKQANPLRGNLIEEFVPCGAVAGLIARTDIQRGVWKAPAGTEATLVGVSQLSVNLTDAENGELNPLGINCLRAFPVAGRVIWGARTLRGGDGLADEYKYIPVRRTALFIEESLFRGTQWAVFEPNDEPLWAQLRLNIGSFMHDLFRQGAFQGSSPREAYLVKCDKETTTQSDINKGIVNVVVGFAPLKPAEFVVIKLQQLAGQIET